MKIWGIPISTIAQSQNFNGKSIAIYGGMSKGLPLANPAQQGLLCKGLIQQAFGNWLGTNMDLDFIVTAGSNAPGTAATSSGAGGSSTTGSGSGSITPATPLNLIFNWQANTPLKTAIENTLRTALPGFTTKINISDKLVKTYEINGFSQNLEQFSQYIRRLSIDIISSSPYGGTGYRGVQINLVGTEFTIFDGTASGTQAAGSNSAAKEIVFTDLVGQPTWRSGYLAQVTCVLRGDLAVGQTIKLPQTQTAVQPSLAFPQIRQSSIFQGNFIVQQLRHVGNYKQPRGAAWVTVIDCYPSVANSTGGITTDQIVARGGT